ncbi:MAG: hypothetical protein JJE01_13900 [Gemmatimonadetes bacterium]|nr:hypothetical protein [Gemmatimonadota bacterium]
MDNLGFIVAGYSLTWATLLWYSWRTNRRLGVAAHALSEWTESSDGLTDGYEADAPPA